MFRKELGFRLSVNDLNLSYRIQNRDLKNKQRLIIAKLIQQHNREKIFNNEKAVIAKTHHIVLGKIEKERSEVSESQ